MPNQSPRNVAAAFLVELGNGDPFLFDLETSPTDRLAGLEPDYFQLDSCMAPDFVPQDGTVRQNALEPVAAMTGLDPDAFTSPDRTGVCRAGRSAPSQCEMVVGVRFRSPIHLSILTVPTVHAES